MSQPQPESSTIFRKERGLASSPNFHPGRDVHGPRGLEGPAYPSFGHGQAANVGRTTSNVGSAFVPMTMHLGAPGSA